ncbi:cell division inhibitor SepF [Peptoniphilus asaccharolyticus DSM 20463]|uniref:Cell division protein SepF n=1 Tax=Peptoniphilus asaccharolyticus DSM 20463 TaxID=573058 RepID=A0A1W1UQV7_PEPAS|nr:cell division protein SepF [Peptoniphilus asaccharolyticus]MBL7575043.1 cell division protein SepF [Peptoniphilus asaccharolyticus]MBL7575068.1 cell division protein SepF [Peptoniphilus asaccharolyticus]SMB83477.1 cell division inhibitor SepF [Peptoniphilus asaccharolyticus DSM 20463]
MAEIMDKMKKVFGFSEEYDYEDYEENFPEERHIEETPVRATKRKSDSGVLSLNASNMIISVHEPLSYDESPNVVDDLRADKSVVLNFEQLDLEVKRKIFDFVSGALYAMDGKIQKVNKDIFVLAPKNVEIDGLKEELKNSGMFPW